MSNNRTTSNRGKQQKTTNAPSMTQNELVCWGAIHNAALLAQYTAGYAQISDKRFLKRLQNGIWKIS